MLRRAVLLLTCASMACSSSNFDGGSSTNPNDTGTTAPDTAVADSAPPEDTAVDTKPDPCAAEPGKAKFCLDVKLADESKAPGYELGTFADLLKLNGSGKIFFVLYKGDPTVTTPPPEPVAQITYPPDSEVGAELKLENLPVEIPGSAPAGTYTVIALFADNLESKRGTGDEAILPGDFLLVPTVVGMKISYPQMTLKMDETTRLEVKLQPVRLAQVVLKVAPGLKTFATSNPTVNGDGPSLIGLYDGSFESASWLHLEQGPCVKTNVRTVPTPNTVSFVTTITGTHNLFGAVVDYGLGPEFPGTGTLITATSGPTITIPAEKWAAKTEVELVNVAYGPVSGTTADPNHCE